MVEKEETRAPHTYKRIVARALTTDTLCSLCCEATRAFLGKYQWVNEQFREPPRHSQSQKAFLGW